MGFIAESKVCVVVTSKKRCMQLNIPKPVTSFLKLDKDCTLQWYHPDDSDVADVATHISQTGDYITLKVNRYGAVERRGKRLRRR